MSTSALHGKELWHITVPNAVPVSSITEVSTKSIFSGAAILSHNGAEYGLIPETQDKTALRLVLIPSSETANYESAGINIAKTLHLQRIVRLPNPSTGSDKPAENSSRKCTKRKIEQPPGLKMRYRPFGASSGSSEINDSEPVAQEPPSATRFHVPRKPIAPSSTKRDRNYIDQTDETQSPARVKRRKKPASSDGLTDFEQAQEQKISQNKAPDESPKVHSSTASEADPHRSMITLDNESANTPRPKSLQKIKTHHHKGINSPTSLSKSSSPTKVAASPRNPFPIPNAHPTAEPQTPFPRKPYENTPTLPPSSQITISQNTKPIEESPEEFQHQNTHSHEVQQHPGKTEIHPPTPQVVSKRNDETLEERARRKAEKKQKDSSEEKARGQAEMMKNGTPEERHKAEQKKNEISEERASRKAELKSTETTEEKARRKAKRKEMETPEERNERIIELRKRKERRKDREDKKKREREVE